MPRRGSAERGGTEIPTRWPTPMQRCGTPCSASACRSSRSACSCCGWPIAALRRHRSSPGSWLPGPWSPPLPGGRRRYRCSSSRTAAGRIPTRRPPPRPCARAQHAEMSRGAHGGAAILAASDPGPVGLAPPAKGFRVASRRTRLVTRGGGDFDATRARSADCPRTPTHHFRSAAMARHGVRGGRSGGRRGPAGTSALVRVPGGARGLGVTGSPGRRRDPDRRPWGRTLRMSSVTDRGGGGGCAGVERGRGGAPRPDGGRRSHRDVGRSLR